MNAVALRDGLLAAAAVAFLGIMLASGGRGEREQFVAYEAAGVMQAPPAAVQSVALQSPTGNWALTRTAQGWVRGEALLTTDLTARLTTALQYLHVTRPIRVLPLDQAGAMSEYGFVTPRLSVGIRLDDGCAFDIAFGDRTPVGGQQYVRVTDSTDIYLLSDFIGEEWEALVHALP
jgi:hypothetical protein